MEREKKQVNLYLVSSLKGPKRRNGAYGYVLERKTSKGTATLTNVKAVEDSTEHQSLIIAMLEAAKRLNEPCNLTIYTDDGYIEAALTTWIAQWQQSEWTNKKGMTVADADKWQQFCDVMSENTIMEVIVKEEHEYHDWLMRETESVAKGNPFCP